MNNDLIIVTFIGEEETRLSFQTLEGFKDSKFLGLEDTILIAIDRAGNAFTYYLNEDSQVSSSTSGDRFMRCLLEAILSEDCKEGRRQLSEVGMDAIFLDEMAIILNRSSSALLFYIHGDSLVDTHLLLNSLALLGGTIHHMNFPSQVEKAVLDLGWNY